MSTVANERPTEVGNGETPGSRRAMENMQDTFRQNGMKPADAERKARDLAREWDRKNRR